jgi:hypothetical protein
MTYIYLVENCYGDPNKVYIGKTKSSRKSRHKTSFGSQIKYTEIDQIISTEKKDWVYLESFWINYFKFLGFNVLNKNNGGGGPGFYDEKIKSKMRKPKLNTSNYKWDENRKKLRSKEYKGKKQNEEWIKNRSESQSKSIKCITSEGNILNFKSRIECNLYFCNFFKRKSFLGAIDSSIKKDKLVNKGKLKNYKFEYVEI